MRGVVGFVVGCCSGKKEKNPWDCLGSSRGLIKNLEPLVTLVVQASLINHLPAGSINQVPADQVHGTSVWFLRRS